MSVRRVAWLVLLVAQIARAEPAILLVETRGAPALPALGSQVATQAGRRVVVRTLAAPHEDPMTFAARAAHLVAAGEATVVVWVAPIDRGFLVFAAGRWPGRALVELLRVDVDLGPAELERTVALKIAGLLDTVLAPRAGAVLDIAAAGPAWRLEIGGGAVREPHERGIDGRVGLGASRARRRGAWRVAPMLAGYWQPTGAIEGRRGRASLHEVGVAVAIEAERTVSSWELLARPRVTGAVLDARGVSADGRRGTSHLVAPLAGVEVGVRRAMSDTLSLGVVITGEVALIRHELAIDGQTVVDLGRFRVHVGACLVISP